MADEKPVNAAGPTPAPIDFNSDEFKKAVAEQVQQQMATVDKDRDVTIDPQGGYVPPQPSENPLKAVLEPVIGPALARNALTAQAAKDATLFYTSHPEAVKYMKELEQAFDAQLDHSLKTGAIPYNHEAMWDWYRGKNLDKFVQEKLDAEAKKVAVAAGTVGVEGGARPGVQTKEARELSQEDLGKALSNVSF